MADVGWITGHSYIVFDYSPMVRQPLCWFDTPLSDAGRLGLGRAPQGHHCAYTAPAVRTVTAHGTEFDRNDTSTLRVLGSVENNRSGCVWYYDVVVNLAVCWLIPGGKRKPVGFPLRNYRLLRQ